MVVLCAGGGTLMMNLLWRLEDVSVVKKMFWIDSSTTLALRVLCIISYVMGNC